MGQKPPRPRSVTPSTPLGWIKLAASAVYLSVHAVGAWLTVIIGRQLGMHPLSHPDWPIDLAVIAAGFRVCMAKGCLVDFRPLLSMMSWLQFYPLLDIQKVDAGGCKSYWMSLRKGRHWEDIHVVLYYVHGGAFVGGDACMCGLTFQNWMNRLAARGIHAKVLAVEYPLAPEHAFPDAVVDTAAAYAWLGQHLEGSNTCIIPVADSAGANILVAALAALRDFDSAPSAADAAASATVSAAAASGSTSDADLAESQTCMVDLFTLLSHRIAMIRSSSSSNSINLMPEQRSPDELFLLSPASSSGSNAPYDLTVQIDSGTYVPASGVNGDAAVGGFKPPTAVVLVSPAMDTSSNACFHDKEWVQTHEPRFDYLPTSVVGGGMSHYVPHAALLSGGYVSPVYLASLRGLVSGSWLVLAGGAELMARDIDRFAHRLEEELGSAAVVYHKEPHMPHSWAIIPTPSMWPRQTIIVDFIAQQAAHGAAATAKLA